MKTIIILLAFASLMLATTNWRWNQVTVVGGIDNQYIIHKFEDGPNTCYIVRDNFSFSIHTIIGISCVKR